MLPVVGQWAIRKLVLQLYFVIERKNLLKLVSSESLHAPPTATTEAFAISSEVQQRLAQEMQRKKIVMEGDYKECINNGLVKEAESQLLEIIIMLEDIKSLSSAFGSCSFKWIRRNANDMACT